MRQPYRLESITLRDVGVFENTHLDFPPIKSAEADAEKAEIHIFTGPNGCGKVLCCMRWRRYLMKQWGHVFN